MASHNIVRNARDSSAEEERSQDLPVAFLSAGHRFAPLRGRTARIDTFFVAQMGLPATGAMRLGPWSEANRSKFKTLYADSCLRGVLSRELGFGRTKVRRARLEFRPPLLPANSGMLRL